MDPDEVLKNAREVLAVYLREQDKGAGTARLTDDNARLRAEVERLNAILDRWCKLAGDEAADATALRDQLAALEAEVERLRAEVRDLRKWKDVREEFHAASRTALANEWKAECDALRAQLAAVTELCVCGHMRSSHQDMPSVDLPPTVLGCTVSGCACGPGCIHEGYVAAVTERDWEAEGTRLADVIWNSTGDDETRPTLDRICVDWLRATFGGKP